MSLKRSISFDLDRTLVFQDQSRKLEELVRIAESCGHKVSPESVHAAKEAANQFYDVVAHRFAGRTTELWVQYAEVMATHLEITDQRLANRIVKYLQSYGHEARNFHTPPDASWLLETLQETGRRLFVVSNNLEAEERTVMVGIRRYFQAVYSTVNGVSKADLFGVLLNEQGIDGRDLIHVGNDLVSDYFVPALFGVTPILVVPDRATQQHLSTRPLTTVGSYRALWELIDSDVVESDRSVRAFLLSE